MAARSATGTAVADQTVYRWSGSIGLHLLPGLLLLAGCLAFRPLVAGSGLPAGTGLTLAAILVVAPFQLLYLARNGRRSRPGAGLVAAVAEAAGFRRRLPAGPAPTAFRSAHPAISCEARRTEVGSSLAIEVGTRGVDHRTGRLGSPITLVP